jgi:hypothetical protein
MNRDNVSDHPGIANDHPGISSTTRDFKADPNKPETQNAARDAFHTAAKNAAEKARLKGLDRDDINLEELDAARTLSTMPVNPRLFPVIDHYQPKPYQPSLRPYPSISKIPVVHVAGDTEEEREANRKKELAMNLAEGMRLGKEKARMAREAKKALEAEEMKNKPHAHNAEASSSKASGTHNAHTQKAANQKDGQHLGHKSEFSYPISDRVDSKSHRE